MAAVRIGLAVAWLGFGVLVATLRAGPVRHDLAVASGLVGVALVILTVTPWRRVLADRLGDALLTIAATIAVLGVVILQLGGYVPPLAVVDIIIVLFVAATVTNQVLVLAATALAIGAYAWAEAGRPDATVPSALALVGAFATACVLVLVLANGVKSRLAQAAGELARLETRERELAEKEAELSQLYDVSRTIGAGSNLAAVLPELVGRIAKALGAHVGLVALYVPERERLRVMSPVWVRGHVIPTDPVDLALTEPGLLPKVFVTATSRSWRRAEDDDQDRLLRELDVERAMAAPLRIGPRRIGVVMVADGEASYDAADRDVLESMSTPAALVLDQIARYETATAEREKLAELAELKTEFVSVVSHELRTPLTSIIGVLDTVQRPELAPENPLARELLETATRQTARLRRLIEDLLVVSRLDAAALPVRRRPLAAHNFLAEVLDGIPGAGGHVTLQIDPELERIDADPDHLARILRNLVENALSHAEGADVELGARTADDHVVLFVTDHGPGIPYDRREKIFERFTQLQSHETRSRGGIGLGLHIVRGLTEAMGGTVWFEPTIGGGATFVVRLPRRAAGQSPAGPMATAWNPPST